MNTSRTARPCPQCGGLGYLSSTTRRYKPLCHCCRGAGAVHPEASVNRVTFFAFYQRDMACAINRVEELRRHAGSA